MSQDSLTVYAPAKVNLSLKILGRRDDGYHLLDTHMQKLALFDTLSLSRVESGIHLQCPGGQLPEGEDNLVYKAAALFLAWVAEHRGVSAGVALRLMKNIPVAAGLGGGSSDAAATLLGLNDTAGKPPVRRRNFFAWGSYWGRMFHSLSSKRKLCRRKGGWRGDGADRIPS